MSSFAMRLAAAALTVVVGWACAPRSPSCDACGRQECANMTTSIVRAGGTTERTCCPRCAVHVLRSGSRATSITVRDFETGQSVPVEQAVFVEGSDVHPCRGLMKEPPRDERGCCLTAAYDRCEPSVVAFSSAGAAARFMERHGGLVTSWSVLESSRRPA